MVESRRGVMTGRAEEGIFCQYSSTPLLQDSNKEVDATGNTQRATTNSHDEGVGSCEKK